MEERGGEAQLRRRGHTCKGGVTGEGACSEEGVAPLIQALSTGSSLAGVCSGGVFEPLCEHLSVFLQQQELTQNHKGLRKRAQ